MSKLSYNAKMKAIRKYVTFNHDLRNNLSKTLSKKDKAEITRYYTSLKGALAKPHVVYRPKDPTNIAVIRDYTGQKLPKQNVFIVDSPSGEGRVHIQYGRKPKDKRLRPPVSISIQKEGAFVRTIYPNMRELILNTKSEIDRLLKDDTFYLINSGGDWFPPGTKRQMFNRLNALFIKYRWREQLELGDAETDEDEDDEETEDYKPIFQIVFLEMNFTNQKTTEEYIAERRKAQKAKKKKRSRKRGGAQRR